MRDDRLTPEQRAALDASLDEKVETSDGRIITWRELITEDILSGRWGVLPYESKADPGSQTPPQPTNRKEGDDTL